MRYTITKTFTMCVLMAALVGSAQADQRSQIFNLGMELAEKANYLAQSSYDQFEDWDGTISVQEQAVLFESEAFAASCRLFVKLTEARSGYFKTNHLRTNLYNAYAYLVRSFGSLEREMRAAGAMPYTLRDCERILDRIEREFSQWPSVDNLAYLHQKYVKARDATVYMIERRGSGAYVRHAFKDLEAIFRYNYELGRGKDPWEHLVEVPYETLDMMPEGPMVDLTFDGLMIIEMTERTNRAVYYIENGKKRGITAANLVARYGGWDKVFEVPLEILNKYPLGEPIR
ncbi:MAG: hypothetical protein ACERK6_07405 [Candidatus Aminicenantaceae bacterium]